MTPAADLPLLRFADDSAWEQWLAEHHDHSTGAWLTFAKKGSGAATVSFPEAVETALCFGWIDGQKGRLDETHYRTRFTPRGPRSKWSELNRTKALELIDAGRMRPPGQAQVDAARADGRWEAAYAPQSAATVPDDLRAALDEVPAAAAFFATLTGARRYAFLYRLHHVSSPDARARRIAGYIDLLREGRTLN